MVHRLTISRSIAWKTFSGYFFPRLRGLRAKTSALHIDLRSSTAVVSTSAGDSDKLLNDNLKSAEELYPVRGGYVF